MLLAIDTSAGTSVALVRGAEVIAEFATADTMKHAEVVGALIRQCLEVASVAGTDIEFVACGMGPGPFTGLRVGIAAAKAFAVGAGARFIPIVSHDALAADYFSRARAETVGNSATGTASEAVSDVSIVTDARRRELYWSQYAGFDENGIPVRVVGPALAKPDDLDTTSTMRVDAHEVSAGWLGKLAMLFLEYDYALPEGDALYLRSPDVTPSTSPKRVSQ